ncbi:hypothetical protein B0T10DRAFT_233779 [Thelonectria olida]|uniref:NACHT domain-containing protein n=1 Tax=Thelonectria olida TaxID=1576542 RepID=A0A9P8VUL8_9HYPO|nr:hypothetical protein B0T10DRAFT_233779 [Thelonectria olida]
MAALNPDSFDRALRTFKKSLSPTLAKKFSICTLGDLKDTVRDIQQKEGTAQDGRLRNMVRLRAFVEAMEEFAKVVEIFLNANEFVCFIWIARAHLDSFDKLLDAYSQIGDAIPGLLAYRATFERHPTLAAVLEDYYSDILRFHQEALEVFNRSKWKNFLHATWKTFDTRLGPILQSLSSRRGLLESEKTSASLYEIQAVRENIEKVYKEQTRQATEMNANKQELKIARIKQRLLVSDYQTDQIMPANVKHRSGNASGQWIFNNAEFLTWSDGTSPGHGVLYVHGIPGAGKTTLMSTIIGKLLGEMKADQGSTRCVTAYFYFKHGQKDKNNHNDFLRALLAQLLDRDIVMPERLYNVLFSAAEENLRSTKTLETHIPEAFEGYQTLFLILDGLDACEQEEAECTIEWLLSLVNGGLEASNTHLRLMISGQRDGVLDKILANQPSIALESSPEHLEDITQYCQTYIDRNKRKTKLNIDPELQGKIVKLVTEEAKGMFLYARVVLENLLRQTSTRRLKQELRPGTFPRGLEAAYERVIARVVKESSEAEREDATAVLSLVLCAKRPLRWREIQAFFCIRPEDGEVDYDRFLQVDYKELCGALLDAHQMDNSTAGPEDIVQIVHETARRYLCDRKVIDFELENAKLSIFCAQYLSSEPFHIGIAPDDILQHAKRGYYSFQDYAVQYWFEHLRQCVEFSNIIDSDLFGRSIDLARKFLDLYCLEDVLDKQNDMASHSQVIETIRRLPKDGRERNSHLNFELPTLFIRRQIAKLRDEDVDSDVREMLANLYGQVESYKCPKPWCELFKGCLGTADKLKEHIDRHELPFSCPSDGCFAGKLGFSSDSSLRQHMKDHHSEKKNDLFFPTMHQKKMASIFSAAAKGDLEAVKKALDSGEDVNQTTKPKGSQTPLFLAARHGHLQVCKLLLSRGADDRGHKMTIRNDLTARNALDAAARARRVDIVSLLLQEWPNYETVRSAANLAASNGHIDVVRVLFEFGLSEVTDGNWEFVNPWLLLNAVRSDSEALVQYLLQNGQERYASQDCVDAALHTPAARPILRLLLSTGQPTITNSYLIEKCINGYQLSLAKMLISYPKTRLDDSDLQRCLNKADEKEGFDDVARALRALLDTSRSKQRSVRWPESVEGLTQDR